MAVLPSSLMLLIPIAFSISAKEIRGRIGEGWRHSPQFQGLYGNPESVLVYTRILNGDNKIQDVLPQDLMDNMKENGWSR